MADQLLAIRSEREGGQVVLAATVLNVDGAQADTLVLPSGFGDCYIQRAAVNITPIATMMASPELNGPGMWLVASGAFSDFLSAQRWSVGYAGNTLSAVWEPFVAALWRDGEKMQVEYAEVDTNATPTADATYMVLVQRRRNLTVPPSAPESEFPIFVRDA